MVAHVNTVKSSVGASGFGKRNAPIESALGTELAVNPPTIPMVDHRGDDAESKTIAALEGAYSKGLGVFMLDLGAGLGAAALGGIAGLFKMTGLKGGIDKWLRAPIWALKNTEIGKINEIGYHFTESAEGLVRKAGDTAAADKLDAKLAQKRAALKPQVAAETKTGSLNKLDEILGAPFRAFARWREGITKNKFAVHINNALGVENKGGFFGIGKKAGSGEAKAALVGVTKDGTKYNYVLSDIAELLKNPSLDMFDKHIKGLSDFARSQLDIANTTKDPKVRESANAAYQQASKIANSLREARMNFQGFMGYGKAAKNGITRIMKSLPKAGGRVSVFHALIGLGVAAGVTASWLTSKRENRLGKQALVDMAADIYGVAPEAVTKDMLKGENAHPMLQEASKVYDKQARGRYISSATYTAGDAVLLATLRGLGGSTFNNHGTAGGGGMGAIVPVMAAQMGLPALGQMMVPENQTLNAYAVLRKAEKDGQPMAKEEKTYAVRQLMAAVPAIARNSGENNTMAPAVAAEIVERGMNSAQIIKTLSDPKSFVEITKEAMEKQKSKAAAEPKTEAAKPEVAAKPETRPNTMLQAAAPSKTTQLRDSDYQGRVGLQTAQQLS